jgi:hypothetical protein
MRPTRSVRYGLAAVAERHAIPFYVAAPRSTFDPQCATGASIPIEFRDGARGWGVRGPALEPRGPRGVQPGVRCDAGRADHGIPYGSGRGPRPLRDLDTAAAPSAITGTTGTLRFHVNSSIELAVIGGSGFYDMPGLSERDEITVDTPFGEPSDSIKIGVLEGVSGSRFLARHRPGVTACCLRVTSASQLLGAQEPRSRTGHWRFGGGQSSPGLPTRPPGHTPSAYRPDSGRSSQHVLRNGVVAHIAFAEPFCPALRVAARIAADEAEATVHRDGVYVVMEGPAFSSPAPRANSHREWRAEPDWNDGAAGGQARARSPSSVTPCWRQ